MYAKLLARGENARRLNAFIEESSSIILEEVESDFLIQGRYNPLCKLYGRAGAVEKQLDLWSKYVVCFSECGRVLNLHPRKQGCGWPMER